MKKLLFLAIWVFLGSIAIGQRVYFVYVQSEAGMPFYVKSGEKTYNSTTSGYVILSNLRDSVQTFFVGQKSNQEKELQFSVPIKSADHGFLFKKLQDNWVLFDLQSMTIIKPLDEGTNGLAYDNTKIKDDAYTRLLAKAVDDSTLLREPLIAKKEEVKQTKTEAPAQNIIEHEVFVETPALVVKEAPVQNSNLTDSNTLVINNEEPTAYKPSIVKKYAESSNNNGFFLTFLDTREGITDTIRLFIPNAAEPDYITNAEPPAVAVKPVINTIAEPDSAVLLVVNKPVSESDCPLVATESDFLELRKNMAAVKNGAEMLVEAGKSFKEKCYTTEQIRNLSSLFLTQEGKYLFFQEAKPHVSDKDRFSTLIFEFKEESYQNLFKTLLEK